jgi:ATP-binding protein involved in chromosome partitioning
VSRRIRTYHDVADPGAENIIAQVTEQADRLAGRLAYVKRIVVVASGKGGVGKSALTANLAVALASGGQRVGAADADLNGPSLARMLGAHRQTLAATSDGIAPAEGAGGVRVMSMDLLLPSDDAPLRWNAPDAPDFLWQSTLEGGVLREFLADVQWGELDYLLIDAPPGTDKITRLLQLLPRVDALLLVTTPSEIARFIVAKSARLARDAGVGRVGLAINMSGHVCEACGHHSPLFADGDSASEGLDDARAGSIQDVETWAEVPFDRRLALTTDRGVPFVIQYPDTAAARAIQILSGRLGDAVTQKHTP